MVLAWGDGWAGHSWQQCVSWGEAQNAGQDNSFKHLKLDLNAEQQQILFKTISDFTTSASSQLLKAFNVTLEFLDTNPVEWDRSLSYQSAKKILAEIAVVNDFAECGVALIQDYHNIPAKDEEQHQFLLQVVERHCWQHPDARKRSRTGSDEWLGPDLTDYSQLHAISYQSVFSLYLLFAH